ncbi:MAG TPA: hypothetical protein VFA03_07245 [Acetobacteraceae bacterium]|nr:hypothetical protein [Acetobacteraceae bacterium]
MITVFGTPLSRAPRVIWMLEEMGLPDEVRLGRAARAEHLRHSLPPMAHARPL